MFSLAKVPLSFVLNYAYVYDPVSIAYEVPIFFIHLVSHTLRMLMYNLLISCLLATLTQGSYSQSPDHGFLSVVNNLWMTVR